MKHATAILAQRYAQAFYNVHGEQLDMEDIGRIKKTAQHVSDHRASLALFTLPHCTDSNKEKMMRALLKPLGDTLHMLQPLIHLLIAHQRSILIGWVLRALIACYYQEHEIECFEITTSHLIDKDELEALHSFLEVQTGKTIEVKYNKDQSLIAGIRMQSDAHIWEYSVRKLLQELQGAHIG